MLEKIIAADHYELMKILAAMVDPTVFSQVSGLVHFKIQELSNNTYQIIRDSRVFHDDWVFMDTVFGEGLFYGFVARDSHETILGFRLPKMMGEFVWDGKSWQMREVEDFDLPEQTPAEMRFEISKDYENLKKFLSKS